MPRPGPLVVLGLLLGSATLGVAALATGLPDAEGQVRVGAVMATDLSLPDPDLALVTGHVEAPRLLGLLPLGPAPGRILAVPEDAPDALGPLTPTGERFAFDDPHGNRWVVVEYEASWGHAYGTAVGPDTWDPDAGLYNFVLLVDHTKVGHRLRFEAA